MTYIPDALPHEVAEFVLKLNAPKRLNNRKLLIKIGHYPPSE